MRTKNYIEMFCVKITQGVKICCKNDWYQYGEKATKFFFNLEGKEPFCDTIKNY